jgi:glutamate racemase
LKVDTTRPIGVFDSGVGGLTVLKALLSQLPNESYLYLGDTARLPYGTKSPDSVQRYAVQAAELLVRRQIKYLVVACNTAAAIALPALRARFAPLPVLGVVEPGAAAGCQASHTGRIAVIATESTVRGGAYQRAIAARRSDAQVVTQACPLFVALAEEGWTSGAIVEGVAHRYLDPLFSVPAAQRPDTVVLGCTHFPLLSDAVRAVVGPAVALVDSAQTTAGVLREQLVATGLGAPPGSLATVRLLATDGCERFARVGGTFLGRTLAAETIELVDLAAGLANV